MAREGDAERLVVMLEARITEFEKRMAKASGTATKSYTKMRTGSRTATRQMEQDMVRSTGRINQVLAHTSTKIGTLGKSLIAGFAGGLVAGGISGLISKIGRMASEVAEVGVAAKRAGLDAKSFQELAYVAQQNLIGVDALTDGMKELQLRADEYIVTGAGSAKESFERLGYSAEELNEKLRDPSALFSEIIGKIGELDKAAQIRVADELFGGTGGEQFVQLIAQGEAGIKRTIDEANNLGIVMSDELIAKAAEADRKFNQIATTVDTAVKSAIVDAVAALNDFLATLRRVPEQQLSDLSDRQATLRDEMSQYLDLLHERVPAIEADIREIVTAFDAGTISADEASTKLQELGAVDLSAFPITTGLSVVITRLDQVETRAQEVAAAVAAAYTDPVGAGAAWGDMQDFLNPPKKTKPGSGSTTRDKATEDAERERKAVENLIASLEFEKSLIGLSAVEQAKLNALRQAGDAATDKQREKIEQLIEESYAEEERIQNMTQLYSELGEIGMSAIDGIADAMMDGKLEAEELDQILRQVLKSMLSMGLRMGFTAIMKGLNLPGFATGTANTGGSRGQVMGVVHGQEAVIPLPSGGSVPVVVQQAPAVASQMPAPLIEIHNHTGAEVREERGRSASGVDVTRIVIGAVNTAAAEGKLGTLEQVYGLRRRGV